MVYPFANECDARCFEDYVFMTGYEYKDMLSVTRRGRMVEVKFADLEVVKEITEHYLACRRAA